METFQCRKIPIQGMGLQCHFASIKMNIIPGAPFHTRWLPKFSCSVPNLTKSNIHISLLYFQYVLCGRKNCLWWKKRKEETKWRKRNFDTLCFGKHYQSLSLEKYPMSTASCHVSYSGALPARPSHENRKLTLTLCFLQQQLGLQIPRE